MGIAPAPKVSAIEIRDQERTLAERLISELSETEFHPEKYEDEYRQRILKAIEQKVAGQEIQRVEVEARPPTTDLVETLNEPRTEGTGQGLPWEDKAETRFRETAGAAEAGLGVLRLARRRRRREGSGVLRAPVKPAR
jgi:DNA end-binding protein Ku